MKNNQYNGTNGSEIFTWDNAIDMKYYKQSAMKQKIVRYKICEEI